MFRKKDMTLCIIILALAGLFALLILLAQKDTGGTVRITIDGSFYGEYNLSKDQAITVNEQLGYNKLVIEKGSAYMIEADCPDRYCMDYKPISRAGETIVCLPHKLVVEVIGERDGQQPDVIVP